MTAAPASNPNAVNVKTTAKTAYHVFEEFTEAEGNKAYLLIASNLHANNAEQAVRNAVDEAAGAIKTGTVLVAIPAARFKPTKVTLSTKTVVTLK